MKLLILSTLLLGSSAFAANSTDISLKDVNGQEVARVTACQTAKDQGFADLFFTGYTVDHINVTADKITIFSNNSENQTTQVDRVTGNEAMHCQFIINTSK